MTKFKTGDKVRILDVDSIDYGHKYWRNGDITEVVGFFGGHPSLRRTVGLQYGAAGDSLHVTPDELHAIELVETPNEIEELKQKVSELEEKVKLLESENFTVSPSILSKPTPNDERKQAIEKAKRFVADTQRTVKNDHPSDRGNDLYKQYRTVSEFVVNEEKRTVVALIRYNGFPEDGPIAKGIAKCAPTDVFNEHIGKAIALGRAYGLDVSEFEQAPQPDEVAVGMKVDYPEYSFDPFVVDSIGSVGRYDTVYYDKYGKFADPRGVVIISDTEAQY